MSELDEVKRLRRLPFDGPALHAHVSARACRFRWASSPIPKKRGFVASSRGKAAYRCSHGSSKNSAPLPFAYFADWTDRIAKGELPHTRPPRPQGVERNIVVTTWDWLDDKHYLHDLIASDRRFPTVNAYGPVYGSSEYSIDIIPILDPENAHHKEHRAPVRDARDPGSAMGAKNRCSRRLTGATNRSGTARRTTTTACSTEMDECGSRRRCAVQQSGVLQKRLGPSLGESLSGRAHEPTPYDARSQDQAVHVRRHLLRDASFAVRWPTTRCGPAAAGRSSVGST